MDHDTPSQPAGFKSSFLYQSARKLYHFRHTDDWRKIRQRFRKDDKVIQAYLAGHEERKLQLGCGKNELPGWLNTDYLPDRANIVHLDATIRFPFPDNSFDLILSEHMIEHLPLAGALNMLRECYRILRPGGKLRISTPDADALIRIKQEPDEPLHRAYLDWHAREWMPGTALLTPAVIFNDFYRNWGHVTIFDQQTLVEALRMAGFTEINSGKVGSSSDSHLDGLENDKRMPEGLLQLHTQLFEAIRH